MFPACACIRHPPVLFNQKDFKKTVSLQSIAPARLLPGDAMIILNKKQFCYLLIVFA